MSDIDYSQFYMKNYHNKKTKKPQPPKTPHKKPAKKFFIVALVIIMVLIGLNFSFGNQPFETLKAWINKEEGETLFFLYKSFSSRDKAYAQSLLVRQSGAGGYIYQKNEEYRVVYSVYTDEKDAENVAEKNPTAKVEEKQINTTDDTAKEIYHALIELTNAANQLEDGSIYEARLLEITSVLKQTLDEKKQSLFQEDPKDPYINVLEIIVGGLGSLNVPGFSRTSLLSDLRYIIVSGIIGLPS
ncbi:MAG: hypothetical protein ACOCWI_01390 [Bacillota bacterium]